MKRIIILLFSLLLLIGGSVCLVCFGDLQFEQKTSYNTDTQTPELPDTVSDTSVSFSEKGTFYDRDISVKLSCHDKKATIYFTTDGDDPTLSSSVYTEPIEVAARSAVRATTIKAIAVTENETSEVFLKSYITGKSVYDRFDPSTLVFVLSTDSYNLYDYYYGIATEGYIRDQYFANEYKGGEIPFNAPANWYMSGRESEREMYVEVYDSTGVTLISQLAGARVVGGYSRANTQKSFRLIARNSYSEGNGKFKYAFFQGATDFFGQLFDRYDRITLRDNANDREFACIRDEVSMQLAADAGFPDTQETRPAAVFLNSEYYGFAWLHEAYCEEYLAATYGGLEDNFHIIGAKEKKLDEDTEEQLADDYYSMLALAEAGLTDDASFKDFCSRVDIENLMLYYAIQIYIDNKDWPGNNYKLWKYTPSEGELNECEYLDGKWRFLLFDAEYAWGLYGAGYRDNTLQAVLSGSHMQGDSPILNALLEREDMRAKFSNTVCDLISGAFGTEHVLEVIEDKITECDVECMYALNNGYTSTWSSEESFADSRQQIRDFAEKRPDVMYKSISKVFETPLEYYNITVECPTGAITRLSSQKLSELGTINGRYFTAYSVPLSVSVYNGYRFDRIEINGVEYTESELVLSSDMADISGEINVKVYVSRNHTESAVIISEVYTAGKGDWIELYNPNEGEISTKGLYLSDDGTELNKYRIPTAIIEGKGTVVIVCKNNSEVSALKKMQTNFSLKTGETLYLSDEQGNIISRTTIVDMSEEQSLSLHADGNYHIGEISEGAYTE